jgi:hypothetical protein
MSVTTISSTALTRDIGKTKKAAQAGPVILTEDGQPAYVLMNIEQYKEIIENAQSILDLLTLPGAEDIDFNPPRLSITPQSHS